MKKLLYIMLASSVILTACKKKTISSSDKVKETEVEEVVDVNEKVTLIQFSKSACYGKCPTYTVTLTPDGKMDYNGIANMPLLGSHIIKANSSFAKDILDRANSVNFFEFNDKYDNQYVTDIPSTTLNIETNQRKKTTYARHEIPSELMGLNTYVHEEIMKIVEMVSDSKKEPRVIEGINPGKIKQIPEKRILH